MSKEEKFAGYVVVANPPELGRILETLFTDEYMKKYTNFDNFEAFRYSSAVIVDWERDPMIYSRVLLDNFVNESTSFNTFDQMVLHASKEKSKT